MIWPLPPSPAFRYPGDHCDPLLLKTLTSYVFDEESTVGGKIHYRLINAASLADTIFQVLGWREVIKEDLTGKGAGSHWKDDLYVLPALTPKRQSINAQQSSPTAAVCS